MSIDDDDTTDGAPLVDPAAFAELEANVGSDFIPELVAEFLAEAPQILAQMRRALGEGDTVAFRRCAHALKSNGTTFGALPFAALARSLELGVGDAALGLERLAGAFAKLAERLQELGDGR